MTQKRFTVTVRTQLEIVHNERPDTASTAHVSFEGALACAVLNVTRLTFAVKSGAEADAGELDYIVFHRIDDTVVKLNVEELYSFLVDQPEAGAVPRIYNRLEFVGLIAGRSDLPRGVISDYFRTVEKEDGCVWIAMVPGRLEEVIAHIRR